jgi:hypothetical protein
MFPDYRGQTAYIVGCGPSLAFLQAKHFSYGNGPVITLNDAIIVAQKLNLSNPLYAMQKDGCFNRPCFCMGENATVRLQAHVTLVVQNSYSAHCFPQHERRITISAQALGFRHNSVMSIRMAAALAKLIGCAGIIFTCCDSLINGDLRRYNPHTGQVVETLGSVHYKANNPRLMHDLGRFPKKYVLPEPE